MKILNTILVILFFELYSYEQVLTVDQLQTPEELIENVFIGEGVTISNVKFNYSNFDATTPQVSVGYFDATNIVFPMPEGIVFGTGDIIIASGPNTNPTATGTYSVNLIPNDEDLLMLFIDSMFNETIIEFDFIPNGNKISFNFIFASEEYPDFSLAIYNDAFGIFLSGPGISGSFTNGAINLALLPTTPPENISINNVNQYYNTEYYVSNWDPVTNDGIQYDGHTVKLTAMADVICGETYHIKFAIADVIDDLIDTGCFLEAGSFTSFKTDDIVIQSYNGEAFVCKDSPLDIILQIKNQGITTVNNSVFSLAGNEGLLLEFNWVGNLLPGEVAFVNLGQVLLSESQELKCVINCDYFLPNNYYSFNVGVDNCDNITNINVNAFSPNGDGVNDFFYIHGADQISNTVIIFDRWGEVVATFTNYNNLDIVWNGELKTGGYIKENTYFYVLQSEELNSIENLNIKTSGWVQVVR